MLRRLASRAGACWMPPERLTVSQWADKNRVLSSETSAEPGRWQTDRAPYQREIMNAVNDPEIEKVVVMSSAQVGKSEVILNVLGWAVEVEPCPVLMVQPTVEMAEDFSKRRIASMVRLCDGLRDRIADAKSRDSANTILSKHFPGGSLTLAGANAPAGLASRPCRMVLCDEVDRFPISAGTEGDPVQLAEKRTATFWNRKLLYTSTPTRKGTSRIEVEYNAGTREEWRFECEGCGGMHAVRLKDISFTHERYMGDVLQETSVTSHGGVRSSARGAGRGTAGFSGEQGGASQRSGARLGKESGVPMPRESEARLNGGAQRYHASVDGGLCRAGGTLGSAGQGAERGAGQGAGQSAGQGATEAGVYGAGNSGALDTGRDGRQGDIGAGRGAGQGAGRDDESGGRPGGERGLLPEGTAVGGHLDQSLVRDVISEVCWICPDCGLVMTENEVKRAPARWVASSPQARGIRSFWLNAFMSPWSEWDKLLWEYVRCKDDPARYQVYVNTILGESYEDDFGDMSPEALLERREDYDAEVPEGVLVLTCGIDTQGDRLEYEVVGWGFGEESWGIQRGMILGNPDDARTWAQLDDLLDRTFYRADGQGLRIVCSFIDSGGHYTSAVYRECRKREARRLYAIKGQGGDGVPFVRPPKREASYGALLLILGVDAGKQVISGALRIDTRGARYCHFPLRDGAGYDAVFFQGMLSERLVRKRTRGQDKWAWEKTGAHVRNEAFDCRNYALAALRTVNPNYEALAQRLAKGRALPGASGGERENRRPRRAGVVSRGVLV